MFDKFNEGSIKVIMLAQEEARRIGHNLIGTELLLIGLVAESNGIAAKALKSVGATHQRLRLEVEKLLGHGSSFVAVEIPFSPRAKSVIETASLNAKESGELYVSTEHLLLALLDQEAGFGIQILDELGVNIADLKLTVSNMREQRQAVTRTIPLLRQGDVVHLSTTGPLRFANKYPN